MNRFPWFGETIPKLAGNFLAPNPPCLVRSLLTKAVPGSAQLLAATSLCAPKPPAQGPSGHCGTALAAPGTGQLQVLWDRLGRTVLRDAAPAAGASLVMMMLMLPLPFSADSVERGPEPLRGAGRGGGGGWRQGPAPLGSGLRRRLGYAGGDGGLSPAGSGIR